MKAANAKKTIPTAETGAIQRRLIFGFPLLVTLCWALYGCSQPQSVAYDKLFASYEQTRLKTSGSLDVLGMIRTPDYKVGTGSAVSYLVSQSDTVAASLGQSKNGYKTWFTLVAFDEHTMTARRKYFYLVDELASTAATEPIRLWTGPRRGLRFDCQMVLQTEVLAQPYVTEQARQIAILKQVGENLRRDIGELTGQTGKPSQGNQILTVSGMVVNQVFETVLLELSTSAVPAQKLTEKNGYQFNHINFDKGRIRLILQDDIATVKIGLGLFRHDFELAKAATATERERSPREWFYFIAAQSDSI
jgi:hypothetical protein